MRSVSISAAAFAGLSLLINCALAQSWIQTSAPITNWVSVASSADGTKLVAVAGEKGSVSEVGPIYNSTNSGVTWTAADAPITNWTSVACSAEGSKLIAAANNGGVYVSSDYGATWSPTSLPPGTNWQAVASSADGSNLLAAVGGLGFPFGSSTRGPIFISSDSGVTWKLADLPLLNWSSVVISADGSKLVAGPVSGGGGGSAVYTSTNFGNSWVMNPFPLPYLSHVAGSADGAWILAINFDWVHYWINHNGSQVFSSTNSGTDWQPGGGLGPGPIALASSVDGSRWIAAGRGGPDQQGGPILISLDSGTTWLPTDAPVTNWSSVASSADGSKLLAVNKEGGIWTSQSTPTPLLSIASSDDNIVVSWIIPSLDFALQENLDLNTTNWIDLQATPMLNLSNLQYQVTLSPGSNRFYRLKYPGN